jgi:O-antigen ligase
MQENKSDLKKILQFIFSLLILANVFSFNRTEAFDYKTLHIQIIFCALFFLAGIGIINGRLAIAKNYLNKIILGFFLLNLAYFLCSPYKIASGIQFSHTFIYVGLYFIFLNTFVTARQLNRFSGLLVLSLTLVSVYAILQYFRFDPLKLTNQQVFATFINPNFFSAFLAVNFPHALGKLFLCGGAFKKIIYFSVCLTVLAALVFSGSQAGLIGWLSGLFFFLWLNLLLFLHMQCKKRKISRKFLISLYIFVFFIILLSGYIFRDVYSQGMRASLEERQPIWRATLNMIKAHPLKGVGLGTFVLFLPAYKQPYFSSEQFIRHAWNEFLELWAELGPLGLITFIALLVFISFSSLKLIFNPEMNRQIRVICISGLSSLWAGIILNLGEINLRILYLGIYFWLNLALLSKIRELNLKIPPSQIRLPPLTKGLSFVVIMVLSLFLLKYAFTPLAMYKAYDNKFPSSFGTEFAKEDNLNQARQYFEKLVEIKPNALGAYNNLGNIYLYAGDLDKAMDYYKKALEVNPHYLAANYNLGYAYFLEGKIKEAYGQFALCLRIDPREPYSFFMLRKKILY